MIVIKFKNIEEVDLNYFSKLIYNDIQKFYNKQSGKASDDSSKTGNSKIIFQAICQGEENHK